MRVSKCVTTMKVSVILLLILVTAPFLSDARRGGGGRGGGGRGGGSRGSSSRGSSSRGSSSSSSQSSRGTTYDRKSSKSESQNPAPSAPKLPDAQSPGNIKPSAPKPDTELYPRQKYYPNQQQPPYNPNYKPPDQAGRNPVAPPPPYPGGNAAPPAGAPPAYPGHNVPLPPYPGPQARPPPYSANDRYGVPQQPTVNRPYPQQPTVNRPYPQQPSINNRPYPQQPGIGTNYQQPPPPGFINNRSPFYQPMSGYAGGVGAAASNVYTKPQKQKGLIGNLLSMGKTPKHGGYGGMGYGGSSYGGSSFGMKHGSSKALYPMMPLMMMKKPKGPKMFSPFHRPFMPIFLPIPFGFGGHHHHGYYGGRGYYDIDSDNYRGGCRQPLLPKHSSLHCNATEVGVKCRAVCNEGYRFPDNVDFKENECWHVGGIWRPTRNFEACTPKCTVECLNGGKCSKPDVCACDTLYRGDKCEYHILNCDMRKLAGENSRKLSWSCEHGRNETVCKVKCRNPMAPALEDPLEIHSVTCMPDGNWTVSALPNCDKDTTTDIISTNLTTPTTEVTKQE